VGPLDDERWKAHRAVHKSELRERETAYKELQRRLTALNHAHQQMVERDTDYVRDEVWAPAHAEVTRRIGVIENQITAIQSGGIGTDKQKDSSRANWAVVVSVAALVVTAVGLVLIAVHHG
jgi:hypothetical protein